MKEVVHVPTRELAEEVLRVAKENGLCEFETPLHQMLRQYGSNLGLNVGNGYGYCGMDFYKEENYTIITAEEFLDRYKPKFRPIAMRCTKEQFDAIKSNLVGCCLVGVSNFTKHIYLVNNYLGRNGNIGNVVSSDLNDRQVFEEWNEKTFLECCGIKASDEVNELNQLRKENAELKQQLKAIEDQPKVGDVCLFWDNGNKGGSLGVLVTIDKNRAFPYEHHDQSEYEQCVKATDENIQAKIKELQDDTKTT